MANAVQLFGKTACPDLDERHRHPGNSATSFGPHTHAPESTLKLLGTQKPPDAHQLQNGIQISGKMSA